MEVIPGIQTNNTKAAQDKLDKLAEFATCIHIDVCDGRFVNNLTIGAAEILQLKTNLDFNLHLMVKFDGEQILDFVKTAAKTLIFYPKTAPSPETTISQIKAGGKQVGIALDPQDTVESVQNFLTQADLALVLAVPSGFAGQKFQLGVLPKISQIRQIKPQIKIGVDGGINIETVKLAAVGGADFVVANTAIWDARTAEVGFWALKKAVSEK